MIKNSEGGTPVGHPLIVIKDMSKTFETRKSRTEVIHGIDFELENEEIVALMGGSGCGKTTFA